MRGIRNALDDSGYYCPIHVLGTGHPFTLVALTLSGADSFDGLEWCQTVVDFASGQLGHFQHWDLYAATSPLRETRGLPYAQKVLAHNLVFYAELMQALRNFIQLGRRGGVLDRILETIGATLPNLESQ